MPRAAREEPPAHDVRGEPDRAGRNRNGSGQWYSRFAKGASRFCGRPGVFALAALAIVLWVAYGPVFGFSDTWQLVINTATTIVTFLMVFLIQSTQNRDTEALQVKLDELIRATHGASNTLIDIEDMDEAGLNELRVRYEKLASLAREKLRRGERDADLPGGSPDLRS